MERPCWVFFMLIFLLIFLCLFFCLFYAYFYAYYSARLEILSKVFTDDLEFTDDLFHI